MTAAGVCRSGARDKGATMAFMMPRTQMPRTRLKGAPPDRAGASFAPGGGRPPTGVATWAVDKPEVTETLGC